MSALTESSGAALDGAILKAIAAGLWAWIDAHQDQEIRLKVWFFSKTFHVRDFEPFVEILLGPRP